MDRTSRLVYRNDDEETDIILEVPWGSMSGNIPPPTITFYREGMVASWAYRGVEDPED